MFEVSKEYSYTPPRAFDGDGAKPFAMDASDSIDALVADLPLLGIQGIDRSNIRDMVSAYAMDADPQAPIMSGSSTIPAQYLQKWLPGFVAVMTQVRKIDTLLGVTVAGDWEDAEVVQSAMEPMGATQAYSDAGNIPFSGYNVSYERRSIVRREMGMRIGKLSTKRAAKGNINDSDAMRKSAGVALEIDRNSIGFSGYDDGNNRTYGFLNDPNLPSAVQFAQNAAATSRSWADKTYLEITADIQTALTALRTQSGDNIDPESDAITLVLPTNQITYLSTVTDNGNSVRQWLRENYSNLRVMSAPELNSAVGDVDVCYFYAESVTDENSTDDGKVWTHINPAKFMLVGVGTSAKGSEEDYSMATAGALLKRPWAVVRYLFG